MTNPDFDRRFVFLHFPGYRHSPASPLIAENPPQRPGGRVRQHLYTPAPPANPDTIADVGRHVTLVGSGHNRQYERATIGSVAPLLPQLVLGRAGPVGDDPWTNFPGLPGLNYSDPPREAGARVIPATTGQETVGWLGYAFFLVRPDAPNPNDPPLNVVRVVVKLFDAIGDPPTGLLPALTETLDLQER